MKSRIKSFALTVLVLLAAVSSTSPSCASFAAAGVTGDPEVIRVGGDKSYPPYEYVDLNGSFKGFNVDIIKAVARESGLAIELVPMSWSEALESLESGNVDVIQGMTQSEEREKSFDFSESIVINSQSIFVSSGTVSITGIGDLGGKRVAYQTGDVSKLIVDGIPDSVPIEVEDQRTAMEMITSGKADAFIGNRLTGMYNIQTFGKADDIKIVGDPMFESPYSIAVANGSTELLAKLNSGLAAIKASGEYDRIYRRWFGEMADSTASVLKGLLTAVGAALLALLAFTLTVVAWNRSLKLQVEKSTRDMIEKNEELQASNRQKSMIIDSMASGIVAFDSRLTVTRSNGPANSLFDRRDIVGMTYYDLGVDEKLGANALQEVDSNGSWRGQVEWQSSSMGKRNIDAIFMPINGPGAVEGYILSFHDYTRESDLQRIVSQRDKMHALGTMSAGIAHEIRNPLSSIKAFIDLLPSKMDDDAFRATLARVVPSEINRLDSLVTTLLDYSKPKRTTPGPVSLVETLSTIVPLVRIRMMEKNIRLTTPESDTMMIVDGSHLKQILIDLILNGIEAVDEGGSICISSWSDNDTSHIAISDDGAGIDESSLDKIFDPFFTTKPDGCGLGLSITQQLVLDNLGSISVSSDKGKGSRFTVSFPGY